MDIGLSWDFFGDKIDLDATVVMLDDLGQIVDAVYYNKLVSDCGGLVHSGDNRDGAQDGFDELIKINLAMVNFKVNYLALIINSYNGEGLDKVETATCSIMSNGAKIHQSMIGGRSDSNASMAGIIYRRNGVWSFMDSSDKGPGKVFTECETLIKDNLTKCGLDPVLLAETQGWNASNAKKFVL